MAKQSKENIYKQFVAPSNLGFERKAAPVERAPWDTKSKRNSQILSKGEAKRNIHKRGFGCGAYFETEVTEGTGKRFRTERSRELGQIQRQRKL